MVRFISGPQTAYSGSEDLRPKETTQSSPPVKTRGSPHPRGTVHGPREVWGGGISPAPLPAHPLARAGTRFPGSPRAGPPRGAALGAFRVLSQLGPRAPPRCFPDSPSSSPGFQILSPALRRARAPHPALGPPRAAVTANEVPGRVRRFKRRLLREAGREIRRCGQNPAGGCERCRAAHYGERAGVGTRSAAGTAARRRGGGGRGRRRAGARLLT
jgi:hypothetical protein